MRFTLQQIKDTHAKVKSGADFPQYAADLKDLGMTGYTIDIRVGKTTYTDIDGAILSTESVYDTVPLDEKVDQERFMERLKLHQEGGTDYPTFCNDCMENGVAGWTLDFGEMTCYYFDGKGDGVVVEIIPGVQKQ